MEQRSHLWEFVILMGAALAVLGVLLVEATPQEGVAPPPALEIRGYVVLGNESLSAHVLLYNLDSSIHSFKTITLEGLGVDLSWTLTPSFVSIEPGRAICIDVAYNASGEQGWAVIEGMNYYFRAPPSSVAWSPREPRPRLVVGVEETFSHKSSVFYPLDLSGLGLETGRDAGYVVLVRANSTTPIDFFDAALYQHHDFLLDEASGIKPGKGFKAVLVAHYHPLYVAGMPMDSTLSRVTVSYASSVPGDSVLSVEVYRTPVMRLLVGEIDGSIDEAYLPVIPLGFPQPGNR